MSTCAALVYIQKDGLSFNFSFSYLEFGLNSEVRARTLVYERKPHIVLIV